MPANCSTDVSLVIDYMDDVLTNGTIQEAHDLEAMFGLQDVIHHDDFMAALAKFPWLWQSNQFVAYLILFACTDDSLGFTRATLGSSSGATSLKGMIDATNSSVRPGAEGVGLQKALAGYAAWMNITWLP